MVKEVIDMSTLDGTPPPEQDALFVWLRDVRAEVCGKKKEEEGAS